MLPCTSSGSDRRGQKGMLGNSCAAGICHSFSSDGRCISLLKILQSNDCIYRCKYCINRAENDSVRATFTPDEICTLVTEFYKRNYIEGLFLSSAVVRDPVYTMELMYRTLLLLRTKYAFNGLYPREGPFPTPPAELIETDRVSGRPHEHQFGTPHRGGAGRPCAPENPRFHPDAHAPDPEPDRGLPPGHWQGCCHGAQPGQPLSGAVHVRHTRPGCRPRREASVRGFFCLRTAHPDRSPTGISDRLPQAARPHLPTRAAGGRPRPFVPPGRAPR